MVKNLPTMQETWIRSPGWEDLLEKEMATHSSTLAWRIPWTEEPGGLQSMGSQRVGHDCVTKFHFSMKGIRHMHTHIPYPLDVPFMARPQSRPSTSQGTVFSSLCGLAASLQLSVFKWRCTAVRLNCQFTSTPYTHTHVHFLPCNRVKLYFQETVC